MKKYVLMPILLGFFAMGFADIVGTVMNQVTAECQLSARVAGFLPSMIFIWFLLISVPAGLLLVRLGRRQTCLLSLAVTAVAMFLGLAAGASRVWIYFVVFALLGIGNTILQAALPALLSNVTAPEKLTSRLTLGQFVKAICAALTPVFVKYASTSFGNWKLLFPVYGGLTVVAIVALLVIPIPREEKREGRGATFCGSLALLADPRVLVLALGVFASVAIDVGFNIAVPGILAERYQFTRDAAGMGPSVFFIAKTAASFVGAFLFARILPVKCFPWTVALALLGTVGAWLAPTSQIFLAAVFVASFGLGNTFGICFGLAIARRSDRTDEVSSLMVMAISGGAVVSAALGFAQTSFGLTGVFVVLLVPLVYLGVLSLVARKG
ncbi:MAG: MFS transporter [Kiritimatiellae bacterium]|nr:MFS transporter [Kiritimatiellia bacterium]